MSDTETLHRVRDFLQAFDSGQDESTVAGEESALLAKDLECEDVSDTYVGWYRRDLEPREIDYVQRQTRDEMARFGYPTEPITVSVIDHLRFHVVDRWLYLVRQLAGRLARRRMNERRALATS